MLARDFQAAGSIVGDDYIEAILGQASLHELGQLLVIVDNQDRGAVHPCVPVATLSRSLATFVDAGAGSATASFPAACSAAGSTAVKIAPFPAPSLAALTEPPCASTRAWQIASPSPSPPNRSATSRSACSNASKIADIRSGAMPMPLSVTRTQ